MTEKPTVAIFVPVYEHTHLLAECLRALLAQEGANLRVSCFVDPANTADRAVLDDFSNGSSPSCSVRICLAARSAYSAAANLALAQAEERYLMILDPADYLLPDFFSRALELAEKHDAELVLCESGKRYILSGELRDRELSDLSMLKASLPDRQVFSAEDVKGNLFRLVRLPSRLSLFRIRFLREKEIAFPALDYPDEYCMGRCALALARRICAQRELLAYLHRQDRCFRDVIADIDALKPVLVAKGLYAQFFSRYAQALVFTLYHALRDARLDTDRYEVLDYLDARQSEAEKYLCQDAQWFGSRDTAAQAAFLNAALRRYRACRAESVYPPMELVCGDAVGEAAVSVIVPVFNTEAYVEEALRSVLSQTLRDIEVICIDDGSTDNSLAILRRLAAEDPRIRVYHQENCGLSVSRNRGLALAVGSYLYFMDSDDVLKPDALQTALDAAEQEEAELVLFNAENIYDSDYPEDFPRFMPRVFQYSYADCRSGIEMFVRMIRNRDMRSMVWLQLIRRDFLLRSGIRFHAGTLYEDMAYTFAVLLHAGHIRFLDQVLYGRRLRRDSITTSEKRFDHALGIFRAYQDILEVYREFGPRLDAEQHGAVRRTLRIYIDDTRAMYTKMSESCRGEEYGLLDDYTLFRLLVVDWCEQAALGKSEQAELKKAHEELREARNALRKISAEANALADSLLKKRTNGAL